MDRERIKKILENVRNGKMGIDEAMNLFKTIPYEDINFAKIDTHRDLRRGFPEVIFCNGKTKEQIIKIVEKVMEKNDFIMATKVSKEVYNEIKRLRKDAIYYEIPKIMVIGKRAKKKSNKKILVISAGTSDIPVAEEAATTAEIMGNKVERLYDVGVSGLHRLFENKEMIIRANVLIVVAGMDGALPSVVSGLVEKPVIAVPTSVGYGASFKGLAALLNMLNSCAPGVVVVNIDNGFGAGYFASIINK
uniref:Nickel pincer cofactor biosynthesis protein LarB n=1 Tax=candidate division WOR-3 bacterium TaxID=2052148 RepID=A0A7C4YIM9_UNCW3